MFKVVVVIKVRKRTGWDENSWLANGSSVTWSIKNIPDPSGILSTELGGTKESTCVPSYELPEGRETPEPGPQRVMGQCSRGGGWGEGGSGWDQRGRQLDWNSFPEERSLH